VRHPVEFFEIPKPCDSTSLNPQGQRRSARQSVSFTFAGDLASEPEPSRLARSSPSCAVASDSGVFRHASPQIRRDCAGRECDTGPLHYRTYAERARASALGHVAQRRHRAAKWDDRHTTSKRPARIDTLGHARRTLRRRGLAYAYPVSPRAGNVRNGAPAAYRTAGTGRVRHRTPVHRRPGRSPGVADKKTA